MGDSVWLFLYFLCRQTGINDAGEGMVLYGNPLSREYIARDSGDLPEWKIKTWTARLIKHRYIRAIRSGNRGMIFFIHKAKSKTKVGTDSHRPKRQVGTELDRGRHESTPTYANNQHENQQDARFPTTLIPKDLSYYNKDAAAQTAAVSISCLAKGKTIPRGMTEKELDERRRFLLRQSEEIQARYGTVHA